MATQTPVEKMIARDSDFRRWGRLCSRVAEYIAILIVGAAGSAMVSTVDLGPFFGLMGSCIFLIIVLEVARGRPTVGGEEPYVYTRCWFVVLGLALLLVLFFGGCVWLAARRQARHDVSPAESGSCTQGASQAGGRSQRIEPP